MPNKFSVPVFLSSKTAGDILNIKRMKKTNVFRPFFTGAGTFKSGKTNQSRDALSTFKQTKQSKPDHITVQFVKHDLICLCFCGQVSTFKQAKQSRDALVTLETPMNKERGRTSEPSVVGEKTPDSTFKIRDQGRLCENVVDIYHLSEEFAKIGFAAAAFYEYQQMIYGNSKMKKRTEEYR